MTVSRLEEKIAHLERTLDELSETVHRQDVEIARLERRVEMLMAREAEREASLGSAVLIGDAPPPHY